MKTMIIIAVLVLGISCTKTTEAPKPMHTLNIVSYEYIDKVGEVWYYDAAQSEADERYIQLLYSTPQVITTELDSIKVIMFTGGEYHVSPTIILKAQITTVYDLDMSQTREK